MMAFLFISLNHSSLKVKFLTASYYACCLLLINLPKHRVMINRDLEIHRKEINKILVQYSASQETSILIQFYLLEFSPVMMSNIF